MKFIKQIFFALLITGIAVSCQQEDDGTNIDAELRRMPFNQQVFMLDSRNGKSSIYRVSYDFQGLQGDATLELLTDNLPQGGHMTVSPDNQTLTVVISRGNKQGRVYIVNISTGEVREAKLFLYDSKRYVPDGIIYKDVIESEVNRDPQYRFKGKITQVDVDEEGYLFIAGKPQRLPDGRKVGFYRVVANWGTGNDPSQGGADIWNDDDTGAWRDSVVPGASQFATSNNGGPELWFHAVPFEFDGENYVETNDDGEDYFDDVTPFNTNRVRFQGGDICFTQNSTETGGFEQQRLLSFSQWKGNSAIALDLEWDWSNQMIKFSAGRVFGSRTGGVRHAFHRKEVNPFHGVVQERVTGASLTGDNMLFTSHHRRNFLNVWNLSGELLASPEIKLADGSYLGNGSGHNWGDLAATQTFDMTIDNDDRLIGEDDPYYPFFDGAQLAEVKLYRPGSKVTNRYDVSDDNPGVNTQARRNSANSDIADLRSRPLKFTSLGSGSMIMKFPEAVTVTENTRLQVVEASWNKLPEYEDTDEAYAAYGEQASVYVASNDEKYYGVWAEDESAWTKVGDAFISSNSFELGGITSFNWVRIIDDNSITPDGFDVNFVAAYEAEPEVEEPTDNEPPCTLENVVLDQITVDPANPEVSSLGIYDNGGQQRYRWRLRNNSANAVTYDYTDGSVGGQVVLQGGQEAFVTTSNAGFLGGVTLEVTIPPVGFNPATPVGSASNTTEVRNLADCDDGTGAS